MPLKSRHLIVGLTGGIAGGKSTVSRMFGDLGARLIDFDVLARTVVRPGSSGLAKVVDHFGKQVLQPDGTLDRKRLSGIVFHDPQKRRQLERLLHPDIYEAFVRKVSRLTADKPDALIVAEVPLLVEADLLHLFDVILLVHSSARVQIERLMHRQDLTENEAVEMLAAQLPVEEKKKYADHVVYNDGSLETTRRQVLAVWDKLITLQRQRSSSQEGFAGEQGGRS